MIQGSAHRMDPLTLVQYNVDLTDADVRASLGIEDSDISGGWKPLPGDENIPPTWDIADALIAGGVAGVLVPSFAPDAQPEHHNLVLWDWTGVPPHQMLVHDPEGPDPRRKPRGGHGTSAPLETKFKLFIFHSLPKSGFCMAKVLRLMSLLKLLHSSAVRTLCFLTLSVFATELVIMLVLSDVFPDQLLLSSILDSAILILILFPVFYFLVVRKLERKRDIIEAAQQALREANSNMETRVEERTREIEGTKRKLEESLGRFADIAETAADWIWEMDEDLRISYLSPRFFEVFPIDCGGVIGKTRMEFAGLRDLDENWRRHMDDLANRRPFFDFAYETAQSDGRPKHVAISGKPIFDASGKFKGYRGTGADKTAEVESRRALEESEKQFRNLVEGSIQGVLVQRNWQILFVNQALAEIFGYESAEEVMALGCVEPLIAPDEFERMSSYKVAREGNEYAPEIYEARGLNKQGAEIWLEFRVRNIEWHDKPALQAAVIDITERKKAEEALQLQNSVLRRRDAELKQQNERFNAALENMSQGLCMFDGEQQLVVCNERYAVIYDLAPEQITPGVTLDQILEKRLANGVLAGNSPAEYIQICTSIARSRERNLAIHELSNGHTIAIRSQPLADNGWLETHEDITEYRQIEKRLAYLAHHDALTKLANRALLIHQLEEKFKYYRPGEEFALLYLDLDGFKGINDTLGHAAGDKTLQVVSERLLSCAGERDIVARLGGDEFAIVQTSSNQPEDAIELARQVSNAFVDPVDLGHQEVVLGVSVGIAVAPLNGDEPSTLLKNADFALYHAKNVNRGSFQLFEQELEARLVDRHALGLDLRRALALGELELYFQPLIDLRNTKICCFEALLRWKHSKLGMVSPSEFIPIAEETGIIGEIGTWVLKQACAEAINWPSDIRIAVNVSSKQFRRGDFVQVVRSALETTKLAADRLELEITESVLLEDDGATLLMLRELKELGVRIAMDDFGTGYSSLSYLRSFPFDKIKIDASFVRDLSYDSADIGIVQAVVGLAARMGLATTAEGVETESQLELLKAEGCTEVQGFLFAPPLPARDILHLLPQLQKTIAKVA